MRARICDHGSLEVLRRGVWRVTRCPFARDIMRDCGDWCPLFDEEIEVTYGPADSERHVLRVLLRCGHGVSHFIASDARPEGKENPQC